MKERRLAIGSPERRLGALARPSRPWLLGAVIAVASTAALADRQPVLARIDLSVPAREQYIPQLMSGPGSVAWSPDSREVVYSMAGSLWRQRTDSDLAVQLTEGPGYDYQPDWSPDGRSIVYTSYRDDAFELWLLDLPTGRTARLTHAAAVNLEPRFSPDGRQLAWVSTSYNDRFHLFAARVTADGLVDMHRLTGEDKSPLPRQYSPYDIEISPVWSRDGLSIVYVSNRGHIYGTGGFWRIGLTPGSVPQELHYEETNWRARPDLSPDGNRLVYSSYVGRNGLQLWLLPAAAGGDALPLTYGDHDEVGARWSPDGRNIAFISNRSGGTRLWLLRMPGGAQRELVVNRRQRLRPSGHLQIKVRDEHGMPMPARVAVTDSPGRFFAPTDALIHADGGYDRAERPFEAHYFHSGGDALLDVPAGEITVDIMRGLERPFERRKISVAADTTVVVESTLDRRIDAEWGDAQQWVAGDVHVHMNFGGNYHVIPERLLQQAAAEHLPVMHALIVNREQRIPDIAYSGRGLDPASRPELLLQFGQEFHTNYWGHFGLLGGTGGTLVPGYVGYANTAAASLSPTNADVADLGHSQGALVGYVHPFHGEPHPFARNEQLTKELPVDVALGKIDYLEVVAFSDHRATAGVWYRLLNLGFRIPAAGGSDAMSNYAILHGPVGVDRVYVQTSPGPLSMRNWLAGLAAGHTFATNGPLLRFLIDGQGPGGELAFPAQRHHVRYSGSMRSIVPIDSLEVVCDGKVVRAIDLGGKRTSADFSGTMPLVNSGWCLLRASSAHSEYPILEDYVYATTSPVYVKIAGRRPHSHDDAVYFTAWVDRVTEATERYPYWNSAAEKSGVMAELAAARAVYVSLQ